MGQLVCLSAGVAGPDPDAVLSDVLTGWRRAQLAQNFSADTARRRVASVLRSKRSMRASSKSSALSSIRTSRPASGCVWVTVRRNGAWRRPGPIMYGS
jgi:hypothetical protein